MKRIIFTSAGIVVQKGSFMYTKIILIMAIAILTSSCTELAILSSGATIAVGQNAYMKAYSGIDVLTIISTEKDIRSHAYDALKKEKNGNK
tara:strand:- start:15 stop:287 length:273 start_codon:yes stop_codon:yes gene_type:complete